MKSLIISSLAILMSLGPFSAIAINAGPASAHVYGYHGRYYHHRYYHHRRYYYHRGYYRGRWRYW